MVYLTTAYLSRSDFKPVEFLAALGDLPSAHAADIHARDNEPHCPLAANAMVLRFWNRLWTLCFIVFIVFICNTIMGLQELWLQSVVRS